MLIVRYNFQESNGGLMYYEAYKSLRFRCILQCILSTYTPRMDGVIEIFILLPESLLSKLSDTPELKIALI